MNHEDMRLSLGGGEEVVKITIWINIVFMLNTNENKQYVWLSFYWVFSEAINLVLEFWNLSYLVDYLYSYSDDLSKNLFGDSTLFMLGGA